MRPRRTYLDYIRDILNAAEQIQQFIKDMDFADFSADTRTLYAVIRAFEIIGEAARHIPAQVRRRYPQVPWQDMLAMRNLLIHEYFGVDSEVLWRTIQEDISPLRNAIQEMLADLESQSEN